MPKGDQRNRERDQRIWSLRLSGMTYEEIGHVVGIGRQRVHQICQRLIREHAPPPEQVEEWRATEVARVERLHRVLWPEALRGNHGAIDRAMKLSERRARLLGLDAPQRQEITGADGGPIEVDIGAVLADRLARLGS